MDKAVIIGFALAIVGVFIGAFMKGADPVALFTNIAALMIVIMGAFGAVMGSHSMDDNMNALKAFKKVFNPGKPKDSAETIDLLVVMAEKARREGLLGLEDQIKDVDDPFLKRGVQMAIDGADAATISASLKAEVKAMKERHKATQGWFTSFGVYAPSFGIIGAVIGLMAVMTKLNDPSQLGHGIAGAFVATFWGVFMANGMMLPWANRLKRSSAEEAAQMEIAIQGIMALQSGVAPRALNDFLGGYLAPSQRKAS